MNRRGFLKLAGGLVAAVAAPVFIPADRLEFGVPRTIALPPRAGLGLEYARMAAQLSGPIDYQPRGPVTLAESLQLIPSLYASDMVKMFEEQSVILQMMKMQHISQRDAARRYLKVEA